MLDLVIEHFDLIEGDFQREYHLDLLEALPRMSWRRFMVLVTALGPHSVFALRLAPQDGNDEPVNLLDGEKQEDEVWRKLEGKMGLSVHRPQKE